MPHSGFLPQVPTPLHWVCLVWRVERVEMGRVMVDAAHPKVR